MTVLEVIQRSTDFLARKGVESPRLQVELLLAHVLRVPRLQLYLNFERTLAKTELEAIRGLVKRRGSREPLQHIVGATSFCGLEIAVSPDVLVPRPETELLAEKAWCHLQALAGRGSDRLTALDFGTGSGCLALALAAHCPAVEVCAVDISPAALAVAQENARRHKLSERIRFLAGDGFAALPPGLRFDLLVANPPYIPSGDIPHLQPEVRDHDPRTALDGGPDGLEFYRRLAREAPAFLQVAGRAMLELGNGQAEPVQEIFAAHKWIVERIEADYTGRLRFLTARVAPC